VRIIGWRQWVDSAGCATGRKVGRLERRGGWNAAGFVASKETIVEERDGVEAGIGGFQRDRQASGKQTEEGVERRVGTVGV
jgi:hypothetical protein